MSQPDLVSEHVSIGFSQHAASAAAILLALSVPIN